MDFKVDRLSLSDWVWITLSGIGIKGKQGLIVIALAEFYIFLGHFILKNSDDTHGITAPFFARVHSELQRITGAPAAAR